MAGVQMQWEASSEGPAPTSLQVLGNPTRVPPVSTKCEAGAPGAGPWPVLQTCISRCQQHRLSGLLMKPPGGGGG